MKAQEGPLESVWVRKAAERQHSADPHAAVLFGAAAGQKRKPAASSSSASGSTSAASALPRASVGAPKPQAASSTTSLTGAAKQRDLADRRSRLKVTQPSQHHSHRHSHVQHADDEDGACMEVEEESGKEKARGASAKIATKPTKKQKREEKREQMEKALARQQEVLATYQRNLKASVAQLRQQHAAEDFEFSDDDDDVMDESDVHKVDALLKATMGNYAGKLSDASFDRTHLTVGAGLQVIKANSIVLWRRSRKAFIACA